MPPTNLEKAEADREALKDHLEFLETEVARDSTTPLTLPEVEQYLTELDESRQLLGPNHNQIRLSAAKTVDMAPYIAEYRRLFQLASRLLSGLHGIKMKFPPPATSTSTRAPPSTAPTQQSIKLPPLELPKFSGNLQEWVSFRDLFITAVHQSSLTKVEKLTQLKALLTGEAARQVRSLILSDANYDIAWKALQERYENNRELLFSILRRLMNQTVISSSTATSIRSLIDTTKECVRSLEVLSIPTQHWDAILLFILFTKLDNTSRELWEQSLPDTSVPGLSKMYDFLEQRARALAASTVQPPPKQAGKQQQPHVRAHHTSSTASCKLGCNHAHPLFRCHNFQRQTPAQRQDTIKSIKICINCLVGSHLPSSCPSQQNCKICNRRHHTMLHVDSGHGQQQVSSQPPSQHSSSSTATHQQSQQGKVQSHHIFPSGQLKTGILATALVRVVTDFGEQLHRTLIDGGSTNSHITEQAARRMKLRLQPCNIPMMGLSGNSVGTAKYVTSFAFKPCFSSMDTFSVTALVVKSINHSTPPEKLPKEDWSHLDGLQLADPDFHLPGKVDILLGTEIFWGTLENEKISGASGQPYAIKTSLGYLVAGPNFTSTPVTILNTSANLDFYLQRFWEQETISEQHNMTAEETACEKYFASSHQRDSTGRFTVSLPFKTPTPQLGGSRQAAVRRFITLERKFNSQHHIKDTEKLRKLTQQWNDYKQFMAEYEALGHMSLVPHDQVHSCSPTYYIPHHCVIKESSTTTKLRVVFDASAASTNGTSLNDCMMVGPQLQDNIWDIMLRVRIHPIAFTADIAKMYRQIRVNLAETDLQRIVWREDPSHPLQDYRLLTVTYGTASAPYLAVKCLQQLAIDEQQRFPLGSKVALRDFYVDDVASGCQSFEEAVQTVKELTDLCLSGGFELRKWTTNSTALLQTIPEELRETNNIVELQEDATIKTLGVYWNPTTDQYVFRLNLPPDMPGNYTKRIILSEIAKIYDPLGWLAPAIVACKIFMQDLWKIKYEWDDILPPNLQQQWLTMRSDLADIEQIQIPRCVISSSPHRVTLIGCSDASIKAISATLYIYSEFTDSNSTCYLLTAKTKVTPVKYVTLPRLELNAAVLLSELIKSTVKSLQLNFNEIRAFTDSTISLCWIRSQPTRWKPYIRRRVQAIQDNAPTANWFHVPGDKNPADCASRGISASDLLTHPLWWNAHPSLFSPSSQIPDALGDEIQQIEAEAQVSSHHAAPALLHPFFMKFSSFRKLQRVTAYVLRFINNWTRRVRNTPIQKDALTVSEIITAHNFIIRQLQQSCFAPEYEKLAKNQCLPTTNSILRLQPFISNDKLLRVGGRLKRAAISFEKKHPILLPRGHFLTCTIIMDIHLQHLHAGPAATLSILQQRYWVTNGRDTVRATLRKCVTCARHRAHLMSQVMGDLPPHRINPSRAFSKVGIDYAGPVSIRPMVRSKISLKCWLAIFVCMVTRAIHIEVVSSLSTDCFLAALRRFVARRGKPSDIFSDCGTNFKGADKVLRDFFVISRHKAIQEECSIQQINWHFNPPGAPHFGGLWEAGVKSIKHHLNRVMGSSHLTYEEMHTLVTQIEGILNSRPLVPASSDPSDLGVLTPAHFLIGSPITSLPEPDLMDKKENYLQRWQLLQQRQQLFWKRWSSEYLTRLQQRPKWMKISPELQIGQLVIIKDERLPPLKWKLGRVTAVHPGKDGHIRVATLKTTDGEIKRPVVKLSLLPITS